MSITCLSKFLARFWICFCRSSKISSIFLFWRPRSSRNLTFSSLVLGAFAFFFMRSECVHLSSSFSFALNWPSCWSRVAWLGMNRRLLLKIFPHLDVYDHLGLFFQRLSQLAFLKRCFIRYANESINLSLIYHQMEVACNCQRKFLFCWFGLSRSFSPIARTYNSKAEGQTIANCYSIIMTWPLLQLLQLVWNIMPRPHNSCF